MFVSSRRWTISFERGFHRAWSPKSVVSKETTALVSFEGALRSDRDDARRGLMARNEGIFSIYPTARNFQASVAKLKFKCDVSTPRFCIALCKSLPYKIGFLSLLLGQVSLTTTLFFGNKTALLSFSVHLRIQPVVLKTVLSTYFNRLERVTSLCSVAFHLCLKDSCCLLILQMTWPMMVLCLPSTLPAVCRGTLQFVLCSAFLRACFVVVQTVVPWKAPPIFSLFVFYADFSLSWIFILDGFLFQLTRWELIVSYGFTFFFISGPFHYHSGQDEY